MVVILIRTTVMGVTAGGGEGEGRCGRGRAVAGRERAAGEAVLTWTQLSAYRRVALQGRVSLTKAGPSQAMKKAADEH